MKIIIGLCLIIFIATCKSNIVSDDSNESKSEKYSKRPWSDAEERHVIDIVKRECGQEISEEEIQKLILGSYELFDCAEPVRYEIVGVSDEFLMSIENERYNETAVILKNVCPKVKNVFVCLNDFKKLLPLCLDADQLIIVNMSARLILRFIDFVCHNNGEYTMAFLENHGINCTQEHKDEAYKCVEHTKEKYEKKYDDGNYNKNGRHYFHLSKEECDDYDILHKCVVDVSKQKCDKKIISEVIDDFLIAMKEELNCGHLQNVI